MTSKAPIIRQVAWLSLIPHIALIAVFAATAYAAGITSYMVVGAGMYVMISLALRNLIPKDHRVGMGLIHRGMFAEALPHFQRSYEFFTRHPWLEE